MAARWLSPRGKTPGRQTESGSPIPIGLSKSPQPVTRFLIWRTRFLSVFEEGDIAFGASFGPFPSGGEGLFLRRKDGTVVRILAVEDPTPAGGTFNVRDFEISFTLCAAAGRKSINPAMSFSRFRSKTARFRVRSSSIRPTV